MIICFCIGSLEQMSGNDHALDFGSAFIDLGDLGISHHALDRILASETIAAEQLHASAGHVGSVDGRDELRLSCKEGIRKSLVASVCSLIDQQSCGVCVGFHLRQFELCVLELRDRTAELLSLLDVLNRDIQSAFRNTQCLCGDTDSAAVQRHHCDLEALADFAEEIFLRNRGYPSFSHGSQC